MTGFLDKAEEKPFFSWDPPQPSQSNALQVGGLFSQLED
jgi:hypothetical protein